MKEWFKNIRTELNYVLSFEGFELTESGDIRETDKVKTFSEAEERAQNLRKTLLDRKIHSDVLTFCKAELLVDNYFHAVFEWLLCKVRHNYIQGANTIIKYIK